MTVRHWSFSENCNGRENQRSGALNLMTRIGNLGWANCVRSISPTQVTASCQVQRRAPTHARMNHNGGRSSAISSTSHCASVELAVAAGPRALHAVHHRSSGISLRLIVLLLGRGQLETNSLHPHGWIQAKSPAYLMGVARVHRHTHFQRLAAFGHVDVGRPGPFRQSPA
jgi:hypothetical protein